MSSVNDSQATSPLAVSSYRYPTGWFVVAWSSNVAPGDVKRLHYFGRELVCFRTEGGVVSVLEAYCQHLGGHLGVGGRVEGDDIVCPWHGWQFNVKTGGLVMNPRECIPTYEVKLEGSDILVAI